MPDRSDEYVPPDLDPDTETDARTGGRKLDPELRAMGAMLRLLEEIDVSARPRVVAWLSARYVQTEGI